MTYSLPGRVTGMAVLVLFIPALGPSDASAQDALAPAVVPHDPGLRGGPAGAGGRIAGLDNPTTKFFEVGLGTFKEVENAARGLGPRVNLDSGAGGRARAAAGATSPALSRHTAS